MLFLTFVLVRETNLQESKKSTTLKETIISLAHNTPWKLFAINILFQWTGYFIQSSALVYYYKYYVGSTAMSSLVATIMTMVRAEHGANLAGASPATGFYRQV